MHKIIKPGDDEQNQSATIPARELTRVIHGVYHLNKTFVFGFLYDYSVVESLGSGEMILSASVPAILVNIAPEDRHNIYSSVWCSIH